MLRANLSASVTRPGVSTVLFGSWGREELTRGSDNDWAVIYDRPRSRKDPVVGTAVNAAEREFSDRSPGAQAVFGVAFPVDRLIREIGLEADGNRNQTRRMLLLLECTEVAGDQLATTRMRVLGRYLNYAARPDRPPRFLLNDVVRYWRTLGVDFEGKHRDTKGDDPKWVVRNAKLRTSRKMLFAGGLLPTLLCSSADLRSMAEFLATWLEAPPTDRLAAGFLQFDAIHEGIRAFAAYDRWLAIQGSEEHRKELASLTFRTRESSPLFSEVRKIGRELDRALLALLFDTELQRLARNYLVL